MTPNQESVLSIVHDWNRGVSALVAREFNRLNTAISEANNRAEQAEDRMNTALAYAEQHQPPQPSKQARVT